MEPNTIHCPKCNSTQLHFAKKGFSGKKAVVGGILTGGLGLFAGTIGSNKILANCMSCGNQFSPSELKPYAPVALNTITPFQAVPNSKAGTKTQRIVFMVFFYAITIFLIYKLISSMIESGFSASLFFLMMLIYLTFSVAHFAYKSFFK